jgi:hypothetical protein
LAMFRAISDKELLLPGETRYASAVVAVARHAQCVDPLEQLFASQHWHKDWHKKQDRGLRGEAIGRAEEGGG